MCLLETTPGKTCALGATVHSVQSHRHSIASIRTSCSFLLPWLASRPSSSTESFMKFATSELTLGTVPKAMWSSTYMIITYLSSPLHSCACLHSARVIASNVYPELGIPIESQLIMGPQLSGPAIDTNFAVTVQSFDRSMVRWVSADQICSCPISRSRLLRRSARLTSSYQVRQLSSDAVYH